MCQNENRARLNLVLVCGFSRRNAEIAIEMFREGKLSNHEKAVISSIMLAPEDVIHLRAN